MRVLRQLARDERLNYPATAHILEKSIYVDDILFGADNIPSLTTSRVQLTELMKKARFQLRKWASNLSDLLRDIVPDPFEIKNHLMITDDTLKVLGLLWLPKDDNFRFLINTPSSVPEPTKHAILFRLSLTVEWTLRVHSTLYRSSVADRRPEKHTSRYSSASSPKLFTWN